MYAKIHREIQNALDQLNLLFDYDRSTLFFQLDYGVQDEHNIITDRQKLIYKYHKDLKLNFILYIPFKENNSKKQVSVVYFNKKWSKDPCITLKLNQNGSVTSNRILSDLLYSKTDILKFTSNHETVYYSEPNKNQDLAAVDHIFKNPKKVEIDRGRSKTSKLIDKIVKIIFVMFSTGVIIAAAFMAKFYLFKLINLRNYSSNSKGGLKWALFTLSSSTEVFTWMYTLMIWLFSVDINPQSFRNIFWNHWKIIVSDCISAGAEVILLLVVYPSVDCLTLLAVMSSCLLTPTVILVYDTVFVQHSKNINQGCDIASWFLTFLTYCLSIISYCLNTESIDIFTLTHRESR